MNAAVLTKNQQTSTNRLNNKHYYECVTKRGLDPEWIAANCRTVTKKEASELLGYTAKCGGVWLEGDNFIGQLRPDDPWNSEGKPKDKAPKYRNPLGEYDASLANNPHNLEYWEKLDELAKICYIIDGCPCFVLTEGLFKAIAGCSNEVPTISIPGVEQGLTPGKDDPQGKRFLVAILEKFARAGFGFILAFDADSKTNYNVAMAQLKLGHQLQKFTQVYSVTGLWDKSEGKGMDDYIQKNGIDKFREILSKAVIFDKWEKDFQKWRKEEKERKRRTARAIGIPFKNTIEVTLEEEVFKDNWVVLNDTFYQYTKLGFYKKISPIEVKKTIIKALKEVYETKLVSIVEGEKEEKIVKRFATHRNTESCFKFTKAALARDTPANEHLIPFLNGTLDVRTGELLAHDPKNYLTWNINSDYIPGASCPDVLKTFISESFGEEYLELIQAILYYYLDPTAPYGYFLHVIGQSGTGKGTLLRLIGDLINKDNVTAQTNFKNISTAEKRHQFLTQVRYCYFPDMAGFQSDLQSFYELVDNGELAGRALYSPDGYYKRWNCKYAIGSVSALNIENSGDGWDRRCIPISTLPLNSRSADTELRKKLEDVRGEIISWAMSMKSERRDYLIKNARNEFIEINLLKQEQAIQSDSLKSFLDQCLEPSVESCHTLATHEIYSAYEAYCKVMGLKPVRCNKLIARMGEVITPFLVRRSSKSINGKKLNVPKHFRNLRFLPGLFNEHADDWSINKSLLTEGNMELFEGITQAQNAYSSLEEAIKNMIEYLETTDGSTSQGSYSSYSSYSNQKSNYIEEKSINSDSIPITLTQNNQEIPIQSDSIPITQTQKNQEENNITVEQTDNLSRSSLSSLSKNAETTELQESQPTQPKQTELEYRVSNGENSLSSTSELGDSEIKPGDYVRMNSMYDPKQKEVYEVVRISGGSASVKVISSPNSRKVGSVKKCIIQMIVKM
jgi:putative DNA primase/helicase